MPGPYDFAAAAYDSRNGGEAATKNSRGAIPTGLAFSQGDRDTLMSGGTLPDYGSSEGFVAPPAGLAGVPGSPQLPSNLLDGRGVGGSSSSGGTQTVNPLGNSIYPQNGYQRVASFAEGGAIPTEEDNPLMNSFGTQLQFDINSALKTVGDVFSYGRKLHGLDGPVGGEQKMAAPMPGTPFRETPTDRPMPRPDAFPYGPGQKPFGQRTSANEDSGGQQVAANMPIKPFSQSPNTPPPMMPPGSLPYGPGEKPFGKRVSEAEPDGDEEGAIDTGDGDGDEETA